MILLENKPNYYIKYFSIFKNADIRIKKYYKYYKSIFICSGVQYDDLKQEVYMEILKTLEKYDDGDFLEQKCNKCIGWRLNDILNYSKKHTVFILKELPKEDFNEEDNFIVISDDLKEKEVQSINYPIPFNEDIAHEDIISSQNRTNFKFEDLTSVLTDQEYYVISSVIKDRKTFRELKTELKCSSQWVHQIYKTALKKVKQYLNN